MTDSTARRKSTPDSDARKGIVEHDKPQPPADDNNRPDQHGNLASQLPHRQPGNPFYDLTEDSDTDFPEPGPTPEHSGQRSGAA